MLFLLGGGGNFIAFQDDSDEYQNTFFMISRLTKMGLVIVGMAAWYTFKKKCLERFKKDIQAAKSLLKTLTKYSRIVWLNQLPLIPTDFKLLDVINEKLLLMNRLAQRVLQ